MKYIGNIEKENSNESIEAVAEVVEGAQLGRVGILGDIFRRIENDIKTSMPEGAYDDAKKLAAVISNYTWAGAAKMLVESYNGETVTGEKITPLGRINHVLIWLTNAVFYSTPIHNNYALGAAAYGVSWSLDAVQYYPEILQGLIDIAEKYNLDNTVKTLTVVNHYIDKSGTRKLFFYDEGDAGEVDTGDNF